MFHEGNTHGEKVTSFVRPYQAEICKLVGRVEVFYNAREFKGTDARILLSQPRRRTIKEDSI